MTKTSTLIGFVLAIYFSVHFSAAFAAQESPQQFAFEGRLFQQDGSTPLTDTVNIKFQILNQNSTGNPLNDCVLYEETQSGINLSGSAGVFSVNIGSAQSATKRSGSDPNFSMQEIFKNTGTLTVPVPACPTGSYSPSAGSIRRLRVMVTNTTTGVTETLGPDLVIGSVPQALVAETLQGSGPTDFLKVDGSTAMTEALTFDNWTSAGRPSSPAVGSTGFNTTTGYLESWNGSGWVDYSVGSGGGSITGLTAGRVPFATSATALGDDSSLFWDNTNKRLGIGTTSPSGPLTIAISGTQAFTMSPTTGNVAFSANAPHLGTKLEVGGVLGINRTGSSPIQNLFRLESNDTGAQISVNSAVNPLIINTNFLEQMRVTAAGDVGIGTNSPASKLDISGTNAGGTLRLFDQTATTGVTRSIVRAGAGQTTTNLLEFQNNAGTVTGSVNSSGFWLQPGAPTGATLQAATTSYVDSAVSGVGGAAVTKDGLTPLTGDWDVSGAGSRSIKNVSKLAVGTNTLPTSGVATFNGNVGIGTTAPALKLSVETAGAGNQGIEVTNSGTAIASINSAGGTRGRIQLNDGAGGADVTLDASGDSYLNGGNVGIGTISPTANLHLVSSTAGGTYSKFEAGTQYNGNYKQLSIQAAGIEFGYLATTQLYYSDNNAGGGATTTATVRGQTVTGNIFGKGFSGARIGVLGTNSGVAGTGVGVAGVAIANPGVLAESTGATNDAFVASSRTVTTGRLGYFEHLNSAFTGDALQMDLGQGTGSFGGNFINMLNAGVSKFRVDSTGKVYGDGSGLTGVSGTMSGLTAGRVPFATSATAIGDDSSLLWDNTNKRLSIGGAAGGYNFAVVGSPSSARIGNITMNDGAGQSTIRGGTGGGGSINLQNTASDTFALTSALNTTGANVFAVNARPSGSTENLLQIQKLGTGLFTIDNSGNVGIGTTTPTQKLEINSSTNYSSNFTCTQSWCRTFFSAGAVNLGATANSSGGFGELGTISNHDLAIVTNATTRISVLSGGNVGIGTITPNTKLEVVGGSRFSNTAASAIEIANDVANLEIYATGENRTNIATDNDMSFQADQNNNATGGNFYFYKGSSELLRIQSDGNVGIGTTSPSLALAVRKNEAGSDIMSLTNTSATGYSSLVMNDNSGNTRAFIGWSNGSASILPNTLNLGTTGAHNVELITGGNSRVSITATGDVGVGTTGPTARLMVQGADGTSGSNAPVAFRVRGGNGDDSGKGGEINLQAGRGGGGFSSGEGGDILMTAGAGGSGFAPGNGGHLYLKGGAPGGAGAGGNVFVDGGSNGGNILISTVNTSNVGIGTASPTAQLDVNGSVKLGSAGTTIASMGVCTTSSVTISTTAANQTCSGMPAATGVAVHCSGASAFSGSGTTLYARATGTANQIQMVTSATNTTAMTYTCMWMKP